MIDDLESRDKLTYFMYGIDFDGDRRFGGWLCQRPFADEAQTTAGDISTKSRLRATNSRG